MYPRRGAGGIQDGYREGSYKRQRMEPEYSSPSSYGGYYGGGGGYSQWQRTGSNGGRPGNAFPVVRLRGLPFNCMESDVYDFFTELDIVDVLFVKKEGRFSCDAFVVFALPVQVEFALRKNRQNIGRRYIEVFRSKKQEYYKAIAEEIGSENQRPASRRDQSNAPAVRDNNDNSQQQEDRKNDKDDVEHTGVLKLRGLPFSATKEDIIDFFGDYTLSEDSVVIVSRSDGRATGDAFVEFESAEDSKAAMSKDKMMIGSRYVELFPSTQDVKANAASKSEH